MTNGEKGERAILQRLQSRHMHSAICGQIMERASVPGTIELKGYSAERRWESSVHRERLKNIDIGHYPQIKIRTLFLAASHNAR